MTALPQRARAYLVFLWCVAGLLLAHFLKDAPLHANVLLLALALPLYVLADYFEFAFESRYGNRIVLTIADVPTIVLATNAGFSGLLVICLGTLLTDALHRRPWFKALFNCSTRIITFCAIVLAYQALNETNAVPFSGIGGLLSLVIITGLYYSLTTVMVSMVLSLVKRQPLLNEVRESLRTVHWMHFVATPLGGVLSVLWHVNPWLILPGLIPAITVQRTFQAVTAWREQSRHAQRLANKLERLQSTATAMIASLDTEPLLQTVSTQLAALLDASAGWVVLLEPVGARVVAPPGAAEQVACDAGAYAAALEPQQLRQYVGGEIVPLHPDAPLPWPALLLIPLTIEGRLLGGIGLASAAPISLSDDDQRVLLAFAAQAALAVEHARLFAALQHNQAELVRSSKLAALGTFSAGIGHEFNNLLAGIMGFAELGLQSDDTAEKNEALEVALRSCQRGRSITSGLLTFARRGEPQIGLHQLQELADETLVLVERELAKVNIRVQRRYAQVPHVLCDPGQISQVVMNLVTNARDAMLERGGGTLTVELAQHERWVELAVHDTGSGIPADLLDQVFQPFMTTKGARGGSAVPGTGLGLAICHGIVQNHNGSIAISSSLGNGTRVAVRLPPANAVAIEQRPKTSPAAAGGLRVLVVDDDALVADSVARLLRSEGYDTTVALGGQQALAIYRSDRFDLVISDLVMPGMAGDALLAKLLARDPLAQVIIMTGQVGGGQSEALPARGALAVLSKPFTREELRATLAEKASTLERVLSH
jgi:signal transduction histidine kinase/CheY-like chemotaxis protein